MLVQPATEEDIPQILTLINNEVHFLRGRTTEEIKELLQNFRVIRDRDVVVACGVFEDYAPKIGEIRSVVVHPSYRGRKFGEKIIHELLRLSKPGQQVFIVTSKVEFFKKLGFDNFLEEKQILFYQNNGSSK